VIRSTLILLATVLLAAAGEVRLVWDPNPPGDRVQSYIIYEHIETTFTPIAQVTTNRVTVTNATVGAHCYVVTASNFWGESVFSNEACTLVVEPDPVPAQVAANAFQIFKAKDWTPIVGFTDIPEDFRIEYSETLNPADWTEMVTIHRNPTFGKGIAWSIDLDTPSGFWRLVPLPEIDP